MQQVAHAKLQKKTSSDQTTRTFIRKGESPNKIPSNEFKLSLAKAPKLIGIRHSLNTGCRQELIPSKSFQTG